MNIDFNNIRINHKGYEISIAQHGDLDAEKTVVQEVLVWNVNGDDEIIRFKDNLDSLLDVLKQAKKMIEKDIK